MSIEMPEAAILARQMQAELPGRTVGGFSLRGAERLQRMGFFNRDSAEFGLLVGETVGSVLSRGNTMVVNLTGEQRLILFPEYGGEIFFHENDRSLPARYHFRLDFSDGSVLTVRIASIGGVRASSAGALADQYVVERDFDPDKFEPLDDDLTLDRFALLLAGVNRQLKTVLVGKDAFVVGLSNSSFQDILFRATLHPKWRAADLDRAQAGALYDAVRFVVAERLRLGGKTGFRDLHGRPGGYEPAMGPARKGEPCPRCGSAVEKLAHGGGDAYLCPVCQPPPA